MTIQIAIVLAILAGAIVLFVTEWLRVDLVALLVLLILALVGLVTPEEAFSGFSNPAVITVWAIFIVSGALSRTGVANMLGQRILRVAGSNEVRLIVALMVAVGVMSAIMNNVGATAVLLPAAVGICRQAKIPASKLLMPLAFGSLLGGVTTLIGTPPNLLVNAVLMERGLQPFSLLDFTPLGSIALVVGILFMALIGRRLLPAHATEDRMPTAWLPQGSLTELYNLRERLFQIRIPQGSMLTDKPLSQSTLRERFGVNVVAVRHGGQTVLAPPPDITLHPGDVLLLEGKVDELRAKDVPPYFEVLPDREWTDEDLETAAIGMFEVALSPHATIFGQTLRDIHFREKYSLSVVAIWREGQPRRTGLSDLPLRFGDTLLVQGLRSKFRILQREPDYIVLADPEAIEETLRFKKAPLALGIMALMLTPVVLGWLPIATAGVMGAALMIISGCLTMEEAYRAIEWKAVFLIAGMLPLGLAMEKTGTAQYLAKLVVNAVGDVGPFALLAGLYIFTALLTEVLPSPALAVLMAPIAISTAQGMGANPYAFLMAVVIAISAGSITPVSHPAHVLVMSPGGYRFLDYLKVGLPLNLVILIATLIALPVFFPLIP
ncbi:MAG: SLC13 family permease [Anaerolineae bacterium]